MEDFNEDKDAAKVKASLAGKLVFDLSTYDSKFLIRRVKKRMQTLNMTDLDAYCELASKGPEKEELVRDLAINVTNFMRDKMPFEIFKEQIIPAICEKKKIDDEINVWSAGCASGEEPYSIAILFFEALGRKMHDYKIIILATDMSEAAIKRAETAIYDQAQFRDMDQTYVEKYFTKISEKRYEVKDHIRKLVQFKRHNLLAENPPGKFDVIFCRNTVIYFSKEGKEELFKRIYDALKQDGFFIMGKTETLMGDTRDKFKPISLAERIYQK